MEQCSEEPGGQQGDARGSVEEHRPASHGSSDQTDQLLKGKNLRPDGVDHQVSGGAPRIDGNPGEILDVDRLKAVLALARNDEERRFAEQVGDVVDQNVFPAEHDSGPHDRMAEWGFLNILFQKRLAAKIRQRRVKIGIRNADVHHARNTGNLSGANQRARVGDGVLVSGAAAVESYPVGVIDDLNSGEKFGHGFRIVEPEWERSHRRAEFVRAARVSGERNDRLIQFQEAPGDVFAGVSESSGDGIDGSRHVIIHKVSTSGAGENRRNVRTVCVYCASSERSPAIYHTAATRLGKHLAGHGLTVVYGGGSLGSMGRVADGALSAGGRVIGVLPRFMSELEWGHKNLTELRLVDDLHIRKRTMLELSDAIVALPGGSGTLDELFEALSMKRLGLFLGPIILINVNGYFEPCLQLLSQCITDGFMDERHRAMWSVVSQPEAVFQTIQDAPEWKPNARAFAVQR